jgi:hypothetical protein
MGCDRWLAGVGNKVVLESKLDSLILKYLLEDHMREELFANREFEHSLGPCR